MNKPDIFKAGNRADNWHECAGDEWSDAVVASMKLGGIDQLFFVSGTELTYYQEAIAKAEAKGWPAPKLVTMIQESVALHAAMGASMVTGKPSATAAHCDVGTLHYGAAIHSAWRAAAPVLMAAGVGPRAYPGSMPGARDNPVQWLQEPRDQGEIVRQYTKADHRMEHMDNPGLMVSRLLQLALSPPVGPVYMSLARETARLALAENRRFPTLGHLSVAKPGAPDPDDARTIAGWLVKADNPVIYVERTGRDPAAFQALVALAELLAVPVMETNLGDRVNFPATHPLAGTGPAVHEADVVLAIECIAPWPPDKGPGSETKVAWIGTDPALSRHKTAEFCVDLWITAGAASAARAIHEAAAKVLDKSDLSRIEDRRRRLETRKREMMARNAELAQAAGKKSFVDPRWVGCQIGRLLQPDTILINDAVTNAGAVHAYAQREKPLTYFRSGSSTGGWGAGAAVGAKIAMPEREVILTTGDGFYIFGTPIASLWAAHQHKSPFLTVVFANGLYHTGTLCVDQDYPEGYAAKARYPGGSFGPLPDFAKLAEAGGGYGENVTEPAEVGPALARGLEQVRKGVPAVVAVRVPGPGGQ